MTTPPVMPPWSDPDFLRSMRIVPLEGSPQPELLQQLDPLFMESDVSRQEWTIHEQKMMRLRRQEVEGVFRGVRYAILFTFAIAAGIWILVGI